MQIRLLRSLGFGLLLGLSFSSAAQNGSPLPAGLTREEAALMPDFLIEPALLKLLPPSPPPSQVRTMAEWEEVQALVITWTSFPEVLTEIVRYAVDECKVLIVTDNSSGVSAQLTAEGIPLDSVVFLSTPYNSIWIRDYGPWAVYHSDVDSLAITDYIYNRPTRMADDMIPQVVAEWLDLPLYSATAPPDAWVHTGGNLLRDGLGAAWSSDLLLKENPGKTGFWIDDISRRYFGFEDYHILRRLPFDEIHHLDMHMLPLDEETLVIGQYPEGVADGPQIEANLAFIENSLRTPFGNPYRIIRQTMPPDEQGLYPDNPAGKYRTYTNAIFINKTLLVPIYEEQYDTTALRIYRDNLPGYRVVGIECNDIIALSGALHCITKTIGVRDPLWISHARLGDTYNSSDYYPVAARVRHRAGINGVTLHYRVAPNENYTAVPLMPGFVDDGWYFGAIPPQPAGSEVQYYIEAVAASGKRQARPMPAPEGYFSYRVRAYEQAPEAAVRQSATQLLPAGRVTFRDASLHGVGQRQWLFPGGQPESSALEEEVVAYADPGVYDVWLIVENPLGNDTLYLPAAVQVGAPTAPFSDDFSAGVGAQWSIENADSPAVMWEPNATTTCHGASLRVNNFANGNRFTREYLRASVDLADRASAQVAFDLAYARRSSNDQSFTRWDELRVNVIDQHGRLANVYNKGGTVLATRPGVVSQSFVPANCAEWRRDSIDLSAWAGQAITLEFESINDNGNNLYLDNVSIRANARPAVVFTTPANNTVYTPSGFPFEETLTATGADTDGQVARIELYAGTTLIATDTMPTLSFDCPFEAPGIYYFTAIAYDAEGAASAPAELVVEVEESVAAWMVEPLPLGLEVFPNPATGDWVQLRIRSEDVLPDTEMWIISATGAGLMRRKVNIPAGLSGYALDVRTLPAGTYLLQLRRGRQMTTARLVKGN